MEGLKALVFECVEELLPREKAKKILSDFMLSYLNNGCYLSDCIYSLHEVSMKGLELLMEDQGALNSVLNQYLDMNYRGAKLAKEGAAKASKKSRDIMKYDFHMNIAAAISVQARAERDLALYEEAYKNSVIAGELAECSCPEMAIESFQIAGDLSITASHLGNSDEWKTRALSSYKRAETIQRVNSITSPDHFFEAKALISGWNHK